MSDSAFNYSKLSSFNDEMISQEITSFIKRDGKIQKITVKRSFAEGDFNDVMTIDVIHVM